MRAFSPHPPLEHLLFHVFPLVFVNNYFTFFGRRRWKEFKRCRIAIVYCGNKTETQGTTIMYERKNNNKYFTFNKSFSISLLGSKSPLHLCLQRKKRVSCQPQEFSPFCTPKFNKFKSKICLNKMKVS